MLKLKIMSPQSATFHYTQDYICTPLTEKGVHYI